MMNPKKPLAIAYFFSFFFLVLVTTSFSQTPKNYDGAEILLQLKKLKVLGSVLYIAAHPDDENNTLLPFLAKEKLYRTAYLSLTRGDGGQNLIGDEQGIELGLMRTQELLAARSIDGAEQYFTRAYEFGFSKTAEESLKIWDREKVLADMVWVIRNYQPDIIINRFPPDARAGHGHHAASAILGAEAYAAAADATRFPEQLTNGVTTWQAKRILWNSFNFGGNNTTSEDQLKVNVGMYNPLLGKSYGEIGAEARTMHKCQGEGRPRRRGTSIEYFSAVAGQPAKTDLMDDVNLSWNKLDPSGSIEKLVSSIISNYKIEDASASVPALLLLYNKINSLAESVWKNQKIKEVKAMIIACGNLYFEAVTNQQFFTPQDSVTIVLNSINRSSFPFTLQIAECNADKRFLNKPLNQNVYYADNIKTTFNQSFLASQPYWLQNEKEEGMFTVNNQTLIGKSENDPLKLTLFVRIDTFRTISIDLPILYKYNDPTKGDVYKPVFITPSYLIYSNNHLVLFKKNSLDSANINLTVTPFVAQAATNAVITVTGKGINIHQPDTASISNPGTAKNFQIKIGNYLKPQGLLKDKIHFSYSTNSNNATAIFSNAARTITYDHIPTIRYYYQDAVQVLNIDLKIIGKKIGYIIGAGDKVPQALEAMGYTVSTLSENDITQENLRQYDAIVVGIRAYNIFEWLTTKNEVLNNYVANGGNMIVQYLKSNEVGNIKIKVGPYAFVVNARTRVTEENAAVRILLPNHPALNFPNTITQQDFEGWVQERSTYQAENAAANFEMPLGMNDMGEKETNGSLAIAKYGKGNFVYASLVFFRQLPAAVPGAFRLLANLIALPKNKN